MGCSESKLAVATVEPIKRSKSASSRSNSKGVDSQKKSVQSKGCQTMDYYFLKEGIEEKLKSESLQHDGRKGSNDWENDVAAKEEGDERKADFVLGEENKKMRNGVVVENVLECEKHGKGLKGDMGTLEQEHAKIEEDDGTIFAEGDEAENVNDKVEVPDKVKKVEPTKTDVETSVVEDTIDGQGANDNIAVLEEEEAMKVEPTKAEVEVMVGDDKEKASNTNDEFVV